MKPKAPRRSKKAIRNRLDKEIGAIVRAISSCTKCNRTNPPWRMNWAHFFSRRNLKLRWHPLNSTCLCCACHRWGHDNPILFRDWVKQYLGDDDFQRLLDANNSTEKFVYPDDMNEIIEKFIRRGR